MIKWYILLKDHDGKKKDAVIQLEEEKAKTLVADGVLKETENPEEKEINERIAELKKSIGDEMRKTIADSFAKLDKGLRIETVDREEDQFPGYKNDIRGWMRDVKSASKGGPSEKLQEYIKTLADRIKAPTGESELFGEDIGVLVPTEMSNEIFQKAFPTEDWSAKVDKRTINGNAIEFPAIVEDSRKSGSRHGGIRGYWLGEADQYTASKRKAKKIQFRLEKLGVFVYDTEELEEDGPDTIRTHLVESASKEINFLTNDAIVNGDGIKKPQGITLSPALISVTRTTAGRIKHADVSAILRRFPPWLRGELLWFVSSAAEPDLEKMFVPVTNVAGTENVGGLMVYMPPGGISGAKYGTLYGRPVIPSEFCADLGTTGDIIAVAPSQYRLVAKKTGIKQAFSMHLRFDYGENAWRFSYRCDGHGMWAKAVEEYKTTTTISPFVVLT